MLHLFFFQSTNKKDKCFCLTIITINEVKAHKIALRKFKDYKYLGKPRRLAI